MCLRVRCNSYTLAAGQQRKYVIVSMRTTTSQMQVTSAKLQLAYGRAKEAQGRWQEAAGAYEAAGEGVGVAVGVAASRRVKADKCVQQHWQGLAAVRGLGKFLSSTGKSAGVLGLQGRPMVVMAICSLS